MGWIIILDYRTATVECEEYNDKIEDLDEYVDNKFTHNDYHYMAANGLELTIKELNSNQQQIITKQ